MKWALLLTLALITLVAGDGAWKQNKEYKYKVLIKTLTESSKTNNRWVGTVFRARLLINPQSENLLLAKVDDAEYAEIELSRKWDADFNDNELAYNKRPLNKPFKIFLENGVIHSLSVDRTMTKDQKIQLKAIVSQLQLQVDTNKVEGNSNNAFYKTMEQSLTGNCETTYDISPLSEYLVQFKSDLMPLPELKGEGDSINVDKTRDHNKCTERYSMMNERNEYRMDNNVNHTEVSRIVLSGSLKDYTIQSSDTTNKVTFNDPQLFTTVHYANLKLESMEESTSRFTSRPQIQVGYDSKVEKLSFYSDLQNNDRYYNSNERTSNEQNDRSNEQNDRSNEEEKMGRSNEQMVRSNEQMVRSNEKINRSNEKMSRSDVVEGVWSACYTWFVGSEEMCRQSLDAEYSSDKVENCGIGKMGHRSFCVKKYPGCESSACWSAAIQDICTREFGDRLPVHKRGFIDCFPGFVRHRCCPKPKEEEYE